MAWKTGKHAEAPQGVLCFGGPDPGTVVWEEPEPAAEPAAAPAAAAQRQSTPPPAASEAKRG